eukprot:tig00000455_g1042.t1
MLLKLQCSLRKPPFPVLTDARSCSRSQVYDGAAADAARRLFRGSGALALESLRFTSSGRALLVTFQSDGIGAGDGFQAAYSAVALTAPTITEARAAAATASGGQRGALLTVSLAPGEAGAWLDGACTGPGGPFRASSALASGAAAASVLVPVGPTADRGYPLSCTAAVRTAAGAASPPSAPAAVFVPAVSFGAPTIASAHASGNGSVLLNVSLSDVDAAGAMSTSLDAACSGPFGSHGAAVSQLAPGAVWALLYVPVPAAGEPYQLQCTGAAAGGGTRSSPFSVAVPAGTARLPLGALVGEWNRSRDRDGPLALSLPPFALPSPLTLELRLRFQWRMAAQTDVTVYALASGSSALSLSLSLADGREYLVMRTGGARAFPLSFHPFPLLERWVHVALTVGGAGAGAEHPVCRLYLDGRLAREFACDSAGPGPAAGPEAGAEEEVRGSSHTLGDPVLAEAGAQLADLRLWSVERSAEEVAASFKGLPTRTVGLELYLPLDGDASDRSGRQRHATSTGSGAADAAVGFAPPATPYPEPPGSPPLISELEGGPTAANGPGVGINGSLYVIGGRCAEHLSSCAGSAPFARLDLSSEPPVWSALAFEERGGQLEIEARSRAAVVTDGWRFVWAYGGVPGGADPALLGQSLSALDRLGPIRPARCRSD